MMPVHRYKPWHASMNRTLLHHLKKPVRHLLRRSGIDINAAANEEAFWNHYVKAWESSGSLNKGEFVGSEWNHEEDFISLLTKYASLDEEALEIGCGGGRITSTAVTLFKHVYAADISVEMLRKCSEAVTAPGVSFHKLDGFTLKEFADSSVDVVYSHDVFVQLSSVQAYPYFIEMARVLKKGGIGLVSCYDFADRVDLFKETSLRLWNQRKHPVSRRLHFMTEEMIRVMLGDLFEVLEIDKRRFMTVAFRR
jgi:ubiquinone/menaquinone biosynthesis C-methylase UbiE